jgi:hypothetical protein
MKSVTSAQPFAAPKRADKAKARLERAKLVIVAARERAETAQEYVAQLAAMRPPNLLQRRRLVGKFSGKF